MVCHSFKRQFFYVLVFVLLLVSQIVYIMVISAQVGSTKVQFIILGKDRLMLRHLRRAQEDQTEFLCSAQSSCKSNSTGADLHTEILEKLLTITSHLTTTAPQMCLTGCAAPGQWVPFILHMTGLLCTCYIAAVRPLLLGVAHTGQKQNSGHTGRCDGLGKEQKHLGLSVK